MSEKAAPITVTPDERLATLQAQYVEFKAAADIVNERLDAVKAAIKTAMAEALTNSGALTASGVPRVELPATEDCPGLTLSYRESWRVDARRLKAEDPTTYASYAVKSGSWTLSVAGGRS